MWDLIGSAIGGFLGYKGQDKANEQNAEINSANNAFNAEQASINRNWQAEMSNTSYQRAMLDMRKAGLNPMLAYAQGGAGTGSGGQATASQPHAMKDAVGPAINTALAARTNALQAENMEQQNKLLQAQQEKTRAETQTELNRPENVSEDTALKRGTGIKVAQETHLVQRTFERVGEEISLIKQQTRSEELRQALTEAQTKLTEIDQAYRKGQITFNKWATEVEKANSMIRFNDVTGSAEEAKHENAAGQIKRWIKTLNPLSGLAR